jgi:endonuclease IV
MQIGLKIGSEDVNYTQDILILYKEGYFQYIELFALLGTFETRIDYWKRFKIPFVIHAPHSAAGMNLSLREERENNVKKLRETFKFADSLNAEYILFHAGVNGNIDEVIYQLGPFVDKRCLIENKPVKGLNNEKCIGVTSRDIYYITRETKMNFCLDFGHAICAANSLKREKMDFINELLALQPVMFHLTDGDYTSEYDSHPRYGKGSFPIKELCKLIPHDAKMTNEARHDSNFNLNDFKDDSAYIQSCLMS